MFLFRFLLVTFLELVDTASRVNQHILPGKEGMRSIGNFQFDQGVLVAVFPLDGLPGLCGGLAQEGLTITHIFENNEPVTCRMDTFFHNLFCLKVVRIWPYKFFISDGKSTQITAAHQILTPHIYKLQRDTQIRAAAQLDHGL